MSGSPSSTEPTAADVQRPTVVGVSLELENLVPGARWRGVYQIGEQLPDVTYGKNLKALHVGTMNDVRIRLFRVNDGMRAEVWDRIRRAQNGSLIEMIEALEVSGRRIEVVQAPPTVSLREWSSHRKVSQPEIELMLRQLAQAVDALHKAGLVHLNIRPDMIYVRTTEGGLNVFLGGFDTATLLMGAEPAELTMDPYYAPPEAVGLFHYTREPGLRAWDWWSVGRVIQEIVLGRHVLGHMLERDVTRETPELRARAETLLREQDHMIRAGAVETMPAMDRDLTTLLRGLLASSREARWGFGEVEAWLRHEPVTERYNLPRHERLFTWKDRAYTVAEVAQIFAQADHWDEGLENLVESNDPHSLFSFLGTVNAHKKTKERLDLLMKLREAQVLQELPPAIVGDVVMAIGLKLLAGSNAPLLFRGKKIDLPWLKTLLKPEAQPAGLATAYGLTERAVVQQIEQFDVGVGRMLGEVERIFTGAEEIARQNKWLSGNDVVQQAAFMDVCTESEMALSTIRAEMLKTYACTRDRALDKIFKKKDTSMAELVVVVFTGASPGKFSYVTHRTWNEEQHKILGARGERLAAAATWLRLAHCLQLGLPVFGRWTLFVPFWLITAGVVAFVGQRELVGWLAAALPFVALAVRLLCTGLHRTKLHHRLPSAAAWTFRSDVARCRREAAEVLQADSVPGPREILRSLGETNDEIAKLTLQPPPSPVPPPASFRGTLLVVFASWFFVAALFSGTAWYGVRHPPKPPKIDLAWATNMLSSLFASKPGEKMEKPIASTTQAPAVGVKSIESTLDELRRAKRKVEKQDGAEVKISWPFKIPATAQNVRVLSAVVALPEQTDVADEMARLLLDRYEPATIKGLVAVQVPTASGVGLMLFNGATKKPADRKVFTIGFLPLARSWIEIDSKKAIFLGGL